MVSHGLYRLITNSEGEGDLLDRADGDNICDHQTIILDDYAESELPDFPFPNGWPGFWVHVHGEMCPDIGMACVVRNACSWNGTGVFLSLCLDGGDCEDVYNPDNARGT